MIWIDEKRRTTWPETDCRCNEFAHEEQDVLLWASPSQTYYRFSELYCKEFDLTCSAVKRVIQDGPRIGYGFLYNKPSPQLSEGSIWHIHWWQPGVGLRDKHRPGRDWRCLETHWIQRIWSEWMEYDEHVGHDLKQRIEAEFSSSEPSVAADRLSRRWLLSGPATNMHNRQNSFKHLHWPLPALYIFVQVHAILLTASNLKSNMFKTHEELRYCMIFSHFFPTPSDRSYDLDRSPGLARFISRFSWAETCWRL